MWRNYRRRICHHLGSLTYLNLEGACIVDAGLTAISIGCCALTHIMLGCCNLITDTGVDAVCCLKYLSYLDLGFTRITDVSKIVSGVHVDLGGCICIADAASVRQLGSNDFPTHAWIEWD